MEIEYPREFSEAFKKDMKLIAAIPDEILDKIMDIYTANLSKSTKTVNLVDIEDEVWNTLKIDTQSFLAISRFIFFLPKYFGSKDDKLEFERNVDRIKFGNDESAKLHRLLANLSSSKLLAILLDNQELEKLGRFAIDSFISIEFTSDYRVLETADGNKALIPSVISKLSLTKEGNSNDATQTVVFQLSPERFHELFNSVSKFKNNFDQEQKFIEEISSRGTE